MVSLADEALVWPKPHLDLNLNVSKEDTVVDLAPLILEATVELDTDSTISFPDDPNTISPLRGVLRPPGGELADPSIDWGVDRIPTVCVMELDLDLPERPRYRFVLPDAIPLEFDAALLARDEPVELILSG